MDNVSLNSTANVSLANVDGTSQQNVSPLDHKIQEAAQGTFENAKKANGEQFKIDNVITRFSPAEIKDHLATFWQKTALKIYEFLDSFLNTFTSYFANSITEINEQIVARAKEAFSIGMEVLEKAQQQAAAVGHVDEDFKANEENFAKTEELPKLMKTPKGFTESNILQGIKGRISEFNPEFKEFILPTLNNDRELRGLEDLRGASGDWSARAVGPDGTVDLKAVCPTSARGRLPTDSLHNVYVNVVKLNGKTHMNITTGVINDKKKADAFIAVIKQAYKDNPDLPRPPRIGMHQLNSQARIKGEGSMIEKEHKMAAYIESQLNLDDELKGAVVIHENTGFNIGTEIPVEFIRAQDKDIELQSEAAAKHVKLLANDYPDLGLGLYSEKEPADIQNNLKTIGESLGEALKKLNSANEPEKYARLRALHDKIQVVTGELKLSPVANLAMQHLIDITSGVVTQANCKSGLDRTGAARALIGTMDKMIQDGVPLNEVADFVHNLDHHLSTVNNKLDKLQEQVTEDDWNQAVKDLIHQSGDDNKNIQYALKFQNNFYNELLHVGLPITSRSTGVAGFKWHHETQDKAIKFASNQANPHPGPLLPRFIQTEDGNIQRLVNSKGFLTQVGLDQLSQLSPLRGA